MLIVTGTSSPLAGRLNCSSQTARRRRSATTAAPLRLVSGITTMNSSELVWQALGADVGARPRQQLFAVAGADQIIVGPEIDPLGEAGKCPLFGEQQDRQLARRPGRAPLRDEPQRVAIRHCQAG